MTVAASRPELLSALLDGLDDALTVFDARQRLVFGNHAAMRLLACESGMLLEQFEAVLGREGCATLQSACAGQSDARRSGELQLADGRRARWQVWRAGTGWALRLQPGVAAPVPAPGLSRIGPQPTREMLSLLWTSPLPATLQDDDFRLVELNDAYVNFTGFAREALLGRDPDELQPAQDRAAQRAARRAPGRDGATRLHERRLIDVAGHERWFRITAFKVSGQHGERLLLSVLQDCTAEHVARDRAERSLLELAQWFDLSPVGMLVFDATGLILRSNAAFEALVGKVPVTLADAPAPLQALLGFERGELDASLSPDAPPRETQAWLTLPDGTRRRLRARLRGFATGQGQRRCMAVVEDLSAQEARDLAQFEIGALMNAAGVGVATFDPSRGWLQPPAGRPAPSGGAAGLQAIGRDIVEQASLPDYERLQQALRDGEPTEVRFAVRHPELGSRWLLTRVEPGELASGRRTMSVVTLDVTEQERARRRNEQLLRELSTILEGSTAGIAYLRGRRLVRSNQRFERMLGLMPGEAAGAPLEQLFDGWPAALELTSRVLERVAHEGSFDAEVPMTSRPGSLPMRQGWFSLSVRRAAAEGGETEAVAVLTDISGLKAQQDELQSLLRERELMFSLSDVGIVYLRGGHIERANDAMAALAGYGTGELDGLDPAQLAESAEAHRLAEEQERLALRRHGVFRGERRLRRRDGSLRWVLVARRPVDEADEGAGQICSYVDVDERRRARESLALQAERTRAILDSVLVAIVTVGPLGIEWMNRSARRMLGGGLSDFADLPIACLAAGDDADHPLRRPPGPVGRIDGQAETFECRIRSRDGRQFWVAGSAMRTSTASGGPQVIYALLDIERRREAELSTAQARTSLQRIIETAPMAIALLDVPSGRVLQLNHMAATFFGAPLDDVLHGVPEDWFGDDDARALRADLRSAGTQAEPPWRELQRPQGEGLRHWDVRVVPLPSGEAGGAQALLVASDVTERRAADEARLQAAIAQREMLVREVHHRIKNNLQGVAGLLQHHARRHPEVASTLLETIAQVQAIAQVYGLQVGSSGPLHVASVLQAIAQSVQRTFGRPVEVALQCGDVVDHVLPEAESIPLALSLNELLTNAVKHCVDGAVQCSLGCSGDEVCISIVNVGLLPAGFSLTQVAGGVSGLGLVRSLLPRRGSQLEIAQQQDRVLTRVRLRAPAVRRGI